MIPSLHKSPQGIIYSETAAANYGDNPVFEISTELMPACRLGTPEEVRIFQFYNIIVYTEFIHGKIMHYTCSHSNC